MHYTGQCKGNVRFLKLLFLQSATADAVAIPLLLAVFRVLINVDLCSVVMFTSNGANVMLSSHNGVHVKLRAHSPALLECHCVAHRVSDRLTNLWPD